VIKHLSKYLRLKTLDQIYKALVRSHLDYCDIIISCTAEGKSTTARFNPNRPYGESWKNSVPNKHPVQVPRSDPSQIHPGGSQVASPVEKNAKLSSPVRNEITLGPRWVFLQHIDHPQSFGSTPVILNLLKDCLSPVNNFHRRCSPVRFVSLTGALGQGVSSTCCYWSQITSFFRPNNKGIFGIHDPSGIRYLFQLRGSLRPLRSHKKRHNFVDTPCDVCLCNTGVEDTNHFLFKCPTLATLATTVIGILLKNNLNHLGNQVQLYLYGHHSMSNIDNKAIILNIRKILIVSRPKFRFCPCPHPLPML